MSEIESLEDTGLDASFLLHLRIISLISLSPHAGRYLWPGFSLAVVALSSLARQQRDQASWAAVRVGPVDRISKADIFFLSSLIQHMRFFYEDDPTVIKL
jgi:hypothetical protein